MHHFRKTTHLQIWPPSRLKHGHSSERARTHGNVRQLVSRTVGMDGEQVGAGGIDTAQHECGADVTLVPVMSPLVHAHSERAGGHTGRAAV
jgi:hypothetical protein